MRYYSHRQRVILIMISGIHHFSIIASSESTIEFYSKLGFKEYFRLERTYDTVVLMNGHGIGLEVFIDPRHPPRAINPENIGFRNLALRVDKLDTTIKELGIEAGPIMNDWFGIKFCFITDPDGLPIQLHE